MSRLSRETRSVLGYQMPPSVSYEGARGTAWFAGFQPRAPSMAVFYCGGVVGPGQGGRVWRRRVPERIRNNAAEGGISVVRLPDPGELLGGLLPGAVVVPDLVDIHTDLPDDLDTLRSRLLTSTTREDFRRIRRANFTYRISKDPDVISQFHARHYAPLVAQRFPEDGRVGSAEKLLRGLDRGGELICADIDGTWVAGIFNVVDESDYALMHLGIRDADEAIRQKRVTSALIIRSLERAVELGRPRATLGRSLPFLGRGPVWFKAKWGGILSCAAEASRLHMFVDLRQPGARRMLSASPLIHLDGVSLVVSAWLDPGDKALQEITRDARRFPGITRWFVLGKPQTLDAGMEELLGTERVVPVPVEVQESRPLWLGELLPGLGRSEEGAPDSPNRRRRSSRRTT